MQFFLNSLKLFETVNAIWSINKLDLRDCDLRDQGIVDTGNNQRYC